MGTEVGRSAPHLEIRAAAPYKDVIMNRSLLEHGDETQDPAMQCEAPPGYGDPDTRLGQEDESMQAATAFVSTTGQQPVSALGWGIALGGGALVWAMILSAYIH